MNGMILSVSKDLLSRNAWFKLFDLAGGSFKQEFFPLDCTTSPMQASFFASLKTKPGGGAGSRTPVRN